MLIFLVFIIIFSDIIFQEGNPIPVISGILKLQKNDIFVVQISENPIKYIIKNDKKDSKKYPLLMPGTRHEMYINNKIEQGWKVEATHGSSFVLSKDNITLNAILRMLTQNYIVIEERYN